MHQTCVAGSCIIRAAIGFCHASRLYMLELVSNLRENGSFVSLLSWTIAAAGAAFMKCLHPLQPPVSAAILILRLSHAVDVYTGQEHRRWTAYQRGIIMHHSCSTSSNASAAAGHPEFDIHSGNSAVIAPRPVHALSKLGVRAISVAKHHSAAIVTSGELFTWGSNRDGRLGYSAVDSQFIPRRSASHA